MSHVLVCSDGSVYAPSLYDHAAWAARELGLPCKVVHLLDPNEGGVKKMVFSGAPAPAGSEILLREIMELEANRIRLGKAQGKAILGDARSRLTFAKAPSVETFLQKGSLCDIVEHDPLGREAKIIVIGKRGEHADFAKGHLGSNLERVVRVASAPVLVTPRAFQTISSFLIAYDGGHGADAAVDFVLRMPLLKGARAFLVRAGGADTTLDHALNERAERLEAGGYEVRAARIEGGPDNVIADFIAANEISLLLMGAYSHSRIRNFFIGSTTSAMIRTQGIPVLLMRRRTPRLRASEAAQLVP